MLCISDVYDIVAGNTCPGYYSLFVYKCVALLNLHNSLVVFPQPLPLFHITFLTEFYLITVFATNNCFLLPFWKLSHIQRARPCLYTIMMVTEVSHSAYPDAFWHSLIAKVEILLQVCRPWFYYLNTVPSGQSWKCQALLK